LAKAETSRRQPLHTHTPKNKKGAAADQPKYTGGAEEEKINKTGGEELGAKRERVQ